MAGQDNQWCIAPREFKSHPQRYFTGKKNSTQKPIKMMVSLQVITMHLAENDSELSEGLTRVFAFS